MALKGRRWQGSPQPSEDKQMLASVWEEVDERAVWGWQTREQNKQPAKCMLVGVHGRPAVAWQLHWEGFCCIPNSRKVCACEGAGERPWLYELSTQGPLCCESGLCTKHFLEWNKKLNRTESADTKEEENPDAHVSKEQRQEISKNQATIF